MAANASTIQQQYASGFPPPPFFFLEYGTPAGTVPQFVTEETLSEDSGCLNGAAQPSPSTCELPVQDAACEEASRRRREGLLSAWRWGGRPPPEPVKDFWTAFGTTYSETYHEPTLDSDTLMYVDSEQAVGSAENGDRLDSAVGKQPVDLKDEFKRLYGMYVKESFGLLDVLARGGGEGGQANKWRKIVKLHKNLLHILTRLRTFQAEEEVLERLSRQLEKRVEATESLKRSLIASVSLLEQQLGKGSSKSKVAEPIDGKS
ncbi:mediator complex subunit MED7 [Toxoplasma gondii MAS]|uniref:Mediator of RNA polymerase II transcription subunit 7 n=2 Tax=Toxoplasma gondii TaxID=5811 RepID=A0A086Q9Z0_TOXGO|nr:mediator complex subunit MED7 [Toxoplasma gondii MAS]PUA86055.1 mediator complex subunit MED7 [Toxoplasma gondii TgCATBr9]